MPFGSLWLPVVVSAVVVWFASAIAHMVLRHHRADYRGLLDEEAVAPVLRKAAPSPGCYVIPYCPDPSQLKDPAVLQRFEAGPVAHVTVLRSAPPAMGKHLALWFGFCILVSFVSAYVARITLQPGVDGLLVSRVIGTVGFAGYGLGLLQESIWKGIPWANTVRGLVDAVAYALLTALTFALLWPGG